MGANLRNNIRWRFFIYALPAAIWAGMLLALAIASNLGPIEDVDVVPQQDKFAHFLEYFILAFLTAFALILDANVWNEASMGSPGMENLRWVRPVRPGDTLRVQGKVTSSTPSKSRGDRGRTGFQHRVLNQNDEVVMTYQCVNILARRP